MAWHKLFESIEPHLARIETPEGFGTGFSFGYNAKLKILAIATAAHVVSHADDWKTPIKVIHHKSGTEYFVEAKDRVVYLDRQRDSASILLFLKEPAFPLDALPMIDPQKFKRIGVEVGWVGFPSVAYPELCFFSGSISAFVRKDDCYLIDGVAINGVSGGPVFADKGKGKLEILGSVSAYVPNRVGGSTLPGLLRAQDISSFADTLQTIRSVEEARAKAEEQAKAEKAESPASRPEPCQQT